MTNLPAPLFDSLDEIVGTLCGASLRHSAHGRRTMTAFEWEALDALIGHTMFVMDAEDAAADEVCSFCGEAFDQLDDISLVFEAGRPVCTHTQGCE